MDEEQAMGELVGEIEGLLGYENATHATSIYDRLKVVRRVIAGMACDRAGQFNPDGDEEFALPDLATACRRLRFEVVDLVEAVLSGMDSGLTERKAVTMTIVELLQRKGVYSGKLKAAVDSGEIFQMSEDGGHDRRGARRMGRRSVGPDSASSSPAHRRAAVDV